MAVQIINKDNNESSNHVHAYQRPGTCSMYLISSIPFNVHKVSTKQIFSTSKLIEISGWVVLCCEDCPMYCMRFSRIPGLYPLNASSSIPPVTTTKIGPS